MPIAYAPAVFTFAAPTAPHPQLNSNSDSSKVSRNSSGSHSCCSTSSSSSSVVTHITSTEEVHETSKKFSYSRAYPSVRWPNRKYVIDNHRLNQTQLPISFTKPKVDVLEDGISKNKPEDKEIGRKEESLGMNDDTVEALGKLSYRLKQTELPITFTTPKVDILGDGFSTNKPEDNEIGREGESLGMNDETLEAFGKPSRRVAKKMNKLALKRAQDWRNRVQFLTDSILGLKSDEFVADVLGDRQVQMTPTDFCFLVKCVGKTSWQRSLEVYEWLNLRHWYSPNAPMVATILAVLGKANQEALAVGIFEQAIEVVKSAVQVYNSMMGVYARNGQFHKVQELLDLMRERGCEPDLVSFNTLINAGFRSGPMEPNMALDLLHQVRRSGLQPDMITYNTLLSACSRDSNLEAAIKVYDDMEANRCQPDLWTYNTMLSIYGRCGMSNEAELMFEDLGSKGFLPDAVTYNSLLYAFAREGRVNKAENLREEMVKMGFVEDEMTYNTIIHMYGKQGRCDLALQLYREMKSRGRVPDVVTYTVLIDSLGKADNISEAVNVMSEMVKVGIKPTLRTFSALICGYAKAGKRLEAEETFDCMLRSGIKPDLLAYSVMLDIYLRFDEIQKAMNLYDNMVRGGFTPDLALYELLVRALGRQNEEDQIPKVIDDMEKVCYLSAQVILLILVKSECYNYAAKTLKLAVLEGYCLDRENLLSILGSYSSSGRKSEALDLLNFVKEHMPGSHDLVTEAHILILCKANQLDAALDEYRKSRSYSLSSRSFSIYESLIKGCDETGLLSEASQVLSDMLFVGVQPSKAIYTSVVLMYCKMGIPETAHNFLERAEADGISLEDISIYVSLIEAYGNSNLLEKAEILVASLRQRYPVLDRKAWNALIQVYASKGQYEKARAAFNTMMKDGPSPTVDSVNGLMQALVVDGRLDELYVVVEELQDMGFKISKNSIILMLDAFAQAGNVFEAKKIYHGMKAAGYFPTMHLYRVMIGLLCRVKHVRDVEAMIAEMEEVGFKPDLSIWNSLLKLYTNIEDYRKTAQVYQRIKDDGLKPDEETYNTLIVMYCRDRRPEEGLSLMDEMVKEGLDAKLTTYKSLIAAFGKLQMVEQAEDLFGKMKCEGYKLDLSFYHLMMKMYRSIGHHSKSEELLVSMKEAGIEPTTATMHLLMISFGSSGNPVEAEKVLESLKSSGESISTLTYGSVIDAYLKNGDYNIGIQKLAAMKREGIEPDHRIWTCFIRAASFCKSTSEAMMLLNAVGDAGFDLPVKLLKNSETTVMAIDQLFEKLAPMGDNAALNFVNAVEDFLWAFELRATASWVFQLAIKKEIYRHDIFSVADNDWGADFRKLSAGAALVGLTLWLDHMQDAALEGFPLSPKSVVLVTGTSEYNAVSLNGTLKAYLWEMGSPFRPCKTRSGLFVAKAHSLKMWLKDSPFCFDLELKNSDVLPEINSMQLIDECYIRRGLVPAFKDITERLGRVGPKKFSRLALLSDEKRVKAIQADIDGRKEKLEKLKSRGVMQKKKSARKRKFVRKKPSTIEQLNWFTS